MTIFRKKQLGVGLSNKMKVPEMDFSGLLLDSTCTLHLNLHIAS
jgi:hypothetical protein